MSQPKVLHRKRVPISKRLRFEILERDGFTCRYCGATPDDGALHIDHIIPVADGGKTEADNLITACEPCNTGKGRRVVSGAVQPLPDFPAMIIDAAEVVQAIALWRETRDLRERTILEAAKFIRAEHGLSLPENTLRHAIGRYGVAEVDYAAAATARRVDRTDAQAQTSYLHAVLRNRAMQNEEPAAMPTFVKPAETRNGGCPLGSDLGCPEGSTACATRKDDGGYSACRHLLDGMRDYSGDGDALLRAVSWFVEDWRVDARATIIELFSEREKAHT